MKRVLLLLYGAAFLSLLACGQQGGGKAVKPAGLRSDFVTVNGVRLNYLEWPGPEGNTGPALVLIHGTGDSPHFFGDFAPRFQDRFRVISYARRGHASSEAPVGPYDFDTLVEDLQQLLDSLQVERASLLGLSMGGNEITGFARFYPDRVERLVYLEAGYDWSDRTLLKLQGETPVVAAATSAALASLDAYRKWTKGTWWPDQKWSPGLEAYLRDITRLEEDGRVQEVFRGDVWKSLIQACLRYRRDYRGIRAPTLFLFAETFWNPKAAGPEGASELAAWEKKFEEIRRANIAQIQNELPGAAIRRIPKTTHATILWSQAAIAEIRRFLLEGR